MSFRVDCAGMGKLSDWQVDRIESSLDLTLPSMVPHQSVMTAFISCVYLLEAGLSLCSIVNSATCLHA